MRILILTGLLIVGSWMSIEAASYRVAHERPYDFNTITAALGVAQAGDTMLVADGNYSVATGERFPLKLPASVIVKSLSTSATPHVIGTRDASVIQASDYAGPASTLEQIWISGGGGTLESTLRFGGGINAINANLNLVFCTISDNDPLLYDCRGAAVHATSSRIIMESCTVFQNGDKRANLSGGIFVERSFLMVRKSLFYQNRMSSIETRNSPRAEIEDCQFFGFEGSRFSGDGVIGDVNVRRSVFTSCLIGVDIIGDGTVSETVIEQCYVGLLLSSLSFNSPVIRDSFITGNGTGILCHPPAYPQIFRCVITDNTYSGIACRLPSAPPGRNESPIQSKSVLGRKIENSVIMKNNTYRDGSAVSCDDCKIVNCTITDNEGGDSALYGTNIYVYNSIIWNNIPEAIKSSVGQDGNISVQFSDVEGGHPGQGNIDANPLFRTLGDFHLGIGSPCIDTGTELDLPKDFDGELRPNPSTGMSDIGADEYYDQPYPTPTPTPTSAFTFPPTPTLTPSATPTTTLSATPVHFPRILVAGYLDSMVSTSAGGTLSAWLLLQDADYVEALVGGTVIGNFSVTLTGEIGAVSLGPFPLSKGIPSNRYLVEFRPSRGRHNGESWPYLFVHQ